LVPEQNLLSVIYLSEQDQIGAVFGFEFLFNQITGLLSER
jgi:hypothetical protein